MTPYQEIGVRVEYRNRMKLDKIEQMKEEQRQLEQIDEELYKISYEKEELRKKRKKNRKTT